MSTYVAARLYESSAKLLAHPLQRPKQQDIEYRIIINDSSDDETEPEQRNWKPLTVIIWTVGAEVKFLRTFVVSGEQNSAVGWERVYFATYTITGHNCNPNLHLIETRHIESLHVKEPTNKRRIPSDSFLGAWLDYTRHNLVNKICLQQTCSELTNKLQGCHSQLVIKLLDCRTITSCWNNL